MLIVQVTSIRKQNNNMLMHSFALLQVLGILYQGNFVKILVIAFRWVWAVILAHFFKLLRKIVVWCSPGTLFVQAVSSRGGIFLFRHYLRGVLFLFIWGGNCSFATSASVRVINTIAGGGVSSTGVNTVGTAAALTYPAGVWQNTLGVTYFADRNKVRQLSTDGLLTDYAGNGVSSTSSVLSTGSLATSVTIMSATGVCGDSTGMLYFSDNAQCVVRSVRGGLVYPYVGIQSTTAACLPSGDNIQATSASVYVPQGIAVDTSGQLYVWCFEENKVRMVSADGIITTKIGKGTAGYSGDGGPATVAYVSFGYGLFVNTLGEVYVGDSAYVRKVTNSNIISTFAGTASAGTSVDGYSATSTNLGVLIGLWGDSLDNLFLSCYQTSKIRMVDQTAAIIVTVAGTGSTGASLNGVYATSAQLNYPYYLFSDTSGNIVFSEITSALVRSLTILVPTGAPSKVPSVIPSTIPSLIPSTHPTIVPSDIPTIKPSGCPSLVPTVMPTAVPSITPSTLPTITPTVIPTNFPSIIPTKCPSVGPTVCPTLMPTDGPSKNPSRSPSVTPTCVPSVVPTFTPSTFPTLTPTVLPTVVPTLKPTCNPSLLPSLVPSMVPTLPPSQLPSVCPTTASPTVVALPYIINTIVGGGSEVTGTGTSTSLRWASGVWQDTTGVSFIVDKYNCYIKKSSATQIVSIYAGTGSLSVSDGKGAATSAGIGYPVGVAGDSVGAVYFSTDCVVRKIDIGGIVSTYAGIVASCDKSADGSQATSTKLYNPKGVFADTNGGVYIWTYDDNKVRMVTSAGIVKTVVGTGSAGSSGDGGPATSATVNSGYGVFVSTVGSIFLCDGTQIIRRVSTTGSIALYAGGGNSKQSNVAATSYNFDSVYSIWGDLTGNIYVADYGSSTILKASFSAIMTKIGGASVGHSGDGGYATAASIDSPYFLFSDQSGNLIFSEYHEIGVGYIRSMSFAPTFSPTVLPSTVTTMMPTGNPTILPTVYPTVSPSTFPTGTPILMPTFLSCLLLPFQAHARRYPPSSLPTCIPSTSPSSFAVSTYFVGTILGGGAGNVSLFYPSGVWLDTLGNGFVADTYNYKIRKFDAQLTVSLFAGAGPGVFGGNGGQATSAKFGYPIAVVGDTQGFIYFSDSRECVVHSVDNSGIFGSKAGKGSCSNSTDGFPATSSSLNIPYGIAVDSVGGMYVCAYNEHKILYVSNSGILSTIAGNKVAANAGIGGPATAAEISYPYGIFVDSVGSLYFTESSQFVRRVSSGIITSLAGSTSGSTADGVSSTAAKFSLLRGVWGDVSGNTYLADISKQVVRKIIPSGIVFKIAGTGAFGHTGDGGYATLASLSGPCFIYGDTNGKLLFTENAINGYVRSLSYNAPTQLPTVSISPTQPTRSPSRAPSRAPTVCPSKLPSEFPSVYPSTTPSLSWIPLAPTVVPSLVSSLSPAVVSLSPSVVPTVVPTVEPSTLPTDAPTLITTFPVVDPSCCPSIAPSVVSSIVPSVASSIAPSVHLSTSPSIGFIMCPTFNPSIIPTDVPNSGRPSTMPTIIATSTLPVYSINLFAGSAASDYLDGPASSASFQAPRGVYQDTSGTTYVVESDGNHARKISSDLIVSTLAGTGVPDMSGDGGPASSASLKRPSAIWCDSSGKMFISDSSNSRIRVIVTVTSPVLVVSYPAPIIVSPPDLFYSYAPQEGGADDASGNTRRQLQSTLVTDTISTFCGTGVEGSSDNGLPATSASIHSPIGLMGDTAGRLYFFDGGNNKIRMISSIGIISTVAGTGADSDSGDGGAATSASLNSAFGSGGGCGLFIDSESSIFLTTQYRLRQIKNFIIDTVSGSETLARYQGEGIAATSSAVYQAKSIWCNTNGVIFYGDQLNRIRMISTNGLVYTIAGIGDSGTTGDGGLALSATVNAPNALWGNTVGNLLYGDESGNVLRELSLYFVTPTLSPSSVPSQTPSMIPSSSTPSTNLPSVSPTTRLPSIVPSMSPTCKPSMIPSTRPTILPSFASSPLVYIVSSVAGSSSAFSSGYRNGPVTSALFSSPEDIFLDSSSTMYIADYGNNRIRSIASNIVASVVGSGSSSSTGDGAAASSATLYGPTNVWADSTGRLFVSEKYCVRVVSSSIIGTYYGTKSLSGYSSEGHSATSTSIVIPSGICGDSLGSLYVADLGYNVVRKVSVDGIVKNVLGTTYSNLNSGDDGPATSATVASPYGVFVDSIGNIFVGSCTIGNGLVRVIDHTSSIISTYAGTGNLYANGVADGVAATSSSLNSQRELWGDSIGNLFIADTSNYRIRLVSPSGLMFTVAGTGSYGVSGNDGPATSAEFRSPSGICGSGSTGSIVVADLGANNIRVLYSVLPTATPTTLPTMPTLLPSVSPSQVPLLQPTLTPSNSPTLSPTTLPSIVPSATPSNCPSFLPSKAPVAPSLLPTVLPSVAPTYGPYSVSSYFLETFAGSGLAGNVDDVSSSAAFEGPFGVWMNSASLLYVADCSGYKVRTVTNGMVSSFAGRGEVPLNSASDVGDGGRATSAYLYPVAVWANTMGQVFVSDGSNSRIRMISSSISTSMNIITTFAGTGDSRNGGDYGSATSAAIFDPAGLYGDTEGNLIFASRTGNLIRKVDSAGIITTIAGNGGNNDSGDGGPATCAEIPLPFGLFLNSVGSIYITCPDYSVIRKISTQMIITRFAGTGSSGVSHDGILATASLLTKPQGIWCDESGTLFLSDSDASLIRLVDYSQSRLYTIGGTLAVSDTSGDGQAATAGAFNSPLGLCGDTTGSLYVAEMSGYVVRKLFTVTSARPSMGPSLGPSGVPTQSPTITPSTLPSESPIIPVTHLPTVNPFLCPSACPVRSTQPSLKPTIAPSVVSTTVSTKDPSAVPSALVTALPSPHPFLDSASPTAPSKGPTTLPSTPSTISTTASPTYMPTALPSIAQTDSPSRKPSGNPSLLPTTAPSLCPSLFPTVAPSLNPSKVPSRAPSKLPTELPTLTPSTRPSKRPTMTPTVVPTVFSSIQRPSAVPSVAPTASAKTQWSSLLQSTLIALNSNASNSIVHQVIYKELYVSESGSQNVYGSASSWSTLVNGDLTISSSSYKIESIELIAVEGLTSSPIVASCSDEVKASTILSALILGGTSSLLCSGHTWTTGSCSGAAAVCVDCGDVCSVQNHCSGNSGFSPLSLAPSVNPSCTSSRSSEIRLLSVAFTNVQDPPDIINIVSSVTSSSITATVQLSSKGSAYCGAFASSLSYTPSSIEEILLKNFIASTNAQNVSVVTLNGLSGVTSYDVYCLSVSPIGIKMSLSEMLSNAFTVSTACCKSVKAVLTSNTLPSSQISSKVLSLTLDALPSSSLVAKIQLKNSAGATVSNAFYPDTFTINGNQATSVFQATLAAQSVGTYTVSIVLSGSSAAEYNVVFPSSTITIQDSSTPLPAPVLSSAVFSNDGSYFTVKFNSLTNKAGTGTTFTCSTLLSFPCASLSKCQWMDSGTINVYAGSVPSTMSCFAPGSKVNVVSSSTLRAACVSTTASSCSQQSSWPSASSLVAVTLQASSLSVTPVVVCVAPSVVGPCDSLTIDFTSSSGNGGRAWRNTTMTAISLDGSDVSTLQQFINSNIGVSPPKPIPAGYLTPGVTYNFVVTLCNFLQKCGQSNVKIVALDYAPPVVSLPGSPVRSMTRSSSLTIDSLASQTTCGSSVTTTSNLGLTYSWKVSTSGVDVLSLTSLSKDPSKLLLPAYSLASGITYTMTLTVTSRTAKSASASVSVLVIPGSIYALISGGSAQSVKLADSLTLDGSSSYDEDSQGSTGISAGLSFSWTCIQTSPVYQSNCSSVFSGRFADHSSVTLKALLASASAEVTLTVTDSSLLRTAQSSVTVNVLPAKAAVVGITSNLKNGVMNAGQVLQLYGSVLLPFNSSGNVTWSVDDSSGFNFAQLAQSPITRLISANIANVTQFVYLAFPVNSLPVGATLTFSLQCTVAHTLLRSYSSVTIVVNSPPQPGSFAVSPVSGHALNETFTFVVSAWVDADLPLTYQFGTVSSVSGLFTSLVAPSEKTYASMFMSAGLSSAKYGVLCEARIYDALNANSSADFNVTVKPGLSPPTSALSTFINGSLYSGSGSSDGLKQAIYLGSSLLNSVDCSMATNCAALHRLDCSTSTNTCGACISPFVGESGDSNSPCVDALLSAASSLPNKQCIANCSGHGICQFVEINTNQTVSSCDILSSSCKAVCSCQADYSMSTACDISNADLTEKITARLLVIESLNNLASVDDPTEQSVTGLMNALVSVTQNSDELSSSGISNLLSTTQSVLESAIALDLSTSALSSLLSTWNSMGSTLSSSSSPTRRLTAGEAVTNVGSIQSLLQQYSAHVSSLQLPGLAAVSSTQDNFKLTSQYLSSDSSISLPSTAAESASGLMTSSISLLAGSSAAVSLISLNTELYGGGGDSVGFNSNPLNLMLNSWSCPSASCNVTIVLQNTMQVPLSALNRQMPEFFNTTCSKDVHMVRNYTCLNGQVVTNITCNGLSDYVIYSRCPNVTYGQVCNSLSGSYADSVSGCRVVAQTETNVTCSCSVGSSMQRRLSSDNDSDYSVSYVAMLGSTVHSFEDTVVSIKDLNGATLEKGWAVLVTLGVGCGLVLLAILFASNADKYENKIKEDKMSAKQSLAIFGKSLTVAPLSKAQENRKLKKQLIDSELKMVEQSLPVMLNASSSLQQRIWNEMKLRHRWLGIVYFYSDTFPRAIRVASLATNLVVMLFIQSITYNITNPDDGYCQTLKSESACIAPRSAFATGESKCEWRPDGECAFIEPGSSIKIVLFVAIFSAILSTPLALLADWIMHHIICAPVLKSTRTAPEDEPSGEAVQTRGAENTFLGLRSVAGTTRHTRKHMPTAEYQMELTKLADEIRQYRDTLTTKQKVEFDLLWGLDESGCFKTVAEKRTMWNRLFGTAINANESTDNVHQAVLRDLKSVDEHVSQELVKYPANCFEDASSLNEQQRKQRRELSKRLLFLFQCDLLPGVSGQILQSKSSRDIVSVTPVSRVVHVVGVISLSLLNMGMLVYILLFAIQQTKYRQNAWFKSFILWLLVEILVVSTAIVLVTHILIPSIAMKDVTKIKQKLVDNIREFHSGMHKKKGAEVTAFNAAKYLFVSTRLAQSHPSVKAAAIIAQFSTPWPKQSYQHFTDVTKAYSKKYTAISRSMSLVMVFFVTNLLNVPPTLQDMIIHMVTTTTIGYTILLHIQLFNIFPVLAFGPLLVLCIVVHFVIQSGKAKAKQTLAPLMPLTTGGEESKQGSDDVTYLDKDGVIPTTVDPIHTHLNRRQSVVKGLQVMNQVRNNVIRDQNNDGGDDDNESSEMGSLDFRMMMKDLEDFSVDLSDDDEDDGINIAERDVVDVVEDDADGGDDGSDASGLSYFTLSDPEGGGEVVIEE